MALKLSILWVLNLAPPSALKLSTMVPKLFTISFFVMPMPESSTVSVLSGTMLIKKFGCASIYSGSVMDSYRILSKASEEFEISSRRKISLLE